MRRTAAWTVLSVLAVLSLIGAGPCEDQDLEDSIEPIQSYLNMAIRNNAANVPIDNPIFVRTGQALDPATVIPANITLVRSSDNLQVPSDAFGISFWDVVECLTAHRPYRPAFSQAEALEAVNRKAGRWYDKNAVAACNDLFESGYSIDAIDMDELTGMAALS